MVRRLLLSQRWRHLCLPFVISRLSLGDCFALRSVSKECRLLVDDYFTTMKTLKIACRKKIHPASFKVLVQCKRIRVLRLTKCQFLTDNMLISLLKGNTHLTHLNLSSTTNITAKSLQPVILHCRNLRSLRLAKCSWLTSGAVEALALHQSRLEEVDFSYCNSISEGSLVIFVKKFRHLRILSLQGIESVTDRCLFAISKFSTLLECLNTVECLRITPAGNKMIKNLISTRRLERAKIHRDHCQIMSKNCSCQKSLE